MGKASASKKVARAARTGGGRTSRGQRPWGWYLAITAVVVLGTVTIAFSRDQYQDELAAGSSLEPPYHQGSDLKPDGDHWQSAYGVYLCDAFAPPVTDRRDPKGIHTHGDGVIHVHPFVPSAAGANATLGVFADAVDMTLTDSKIGAPGGDTYDEGSTKCDGKLGRVQVRVEEGGQSRVVVVGLRDVKLND
ncbi:MAG: hypothetical protein ACRD0M_02905, partial [Acidimicrobiales bacterium]